MMGNHDFLYMIYTRSQLLLAYYNVFLLCRLIAICQKTIERLGLLCLSSMIFVFDIHNMNRSVKQVSMIFPRFIISNKYPLHKNILNLLFNMRVCIIVNIKPSLY